LLINLTLINYYFFLAFISLEALLQVPYGLIGPQRLFQKEILENIWPAEAVIPGI
jgi:hypothetical protein